jgi:hypothetical protein
MTVLGLMMLGHDTVLLGECLLDFKEASYPQALESSYLACSSGNMSDVC